MRDPYIDLSDQINVQNLPKRAGISNETDCGPEVKTCGFQGNFRSKMASVYKQLTKRSKATDEPQSHENGVQNKQKVLMLSSRGISYRYYLPL
jgi:hypothetical protein